MLDADNCHVADELCALPAVQTVACDSSSLFLASVAKKNVNVKAVIWVGSGAVGTLYEKTVADNKHVEVKKSTGQQLTKVQINVAQGEQVT